jgi:hypothetical protein
MNQLPRTEGLESDFASADAALPDRLPWPLAAVVIGSLSLGLWALIFVALRAFA